MNEVHERIGSSILLAFATAYFILAIQLPTESPNLSDLGPRIYPLILGIVAVVVSAIWAFQAFRPSRTMGVADDASGSEDGRSWQKVIALVGVATVFPVALESLTFIPTATIVLFALSSVIAWRKPTVRQLLITGAFSLGCAVGLQLLFENVMSIYLP